MIQGPQFLQATRIQYSGVLLYKFSLKAKNHDSNVKNWLNFLKSYTATQPNIKLITLLSCVVTVVNQLSQPMTSLGYVATVSSSS